MRKNVKKALSLLLALVMLLSLSITVSAEENEDIAGEPRVDVEEQPLREEDPPKEQEPPQEEYKTVNIRVMPDELRLRANESSTTIEVVTDGSMDVGELTYEWSSSDSSMAAVSGRSSTATVTPGSKSGTARIIVNAFYKGQHAGLATANVEIEPAVEPVKASIQGYSASSTLTMNVGDTKTLRASVSGGSGEYFYDWDVTGAVSMEDMDDDVVTIVANHDGTGEIVFTVIDDEVDYAEVTLQVKVEGKTDPVEARFDKNNLSLNLNTQKTGTLEITAKGGSGKFDYEWQTSNLRYVDVNGNGSSAVLTALMPGTDTVYAKVIDRESRETHILECNVVVEGSSVKYDTNASATVGSTMTMSTVMGAIGNEFRHQFGKDISYSASVQLTTPSTGSGSIRMQNGEQVRANGSYVFATMQDCYFDPVKSGEFVTTYTATDAGCTISGRITISVVGGGGISSATISNTTMTLDTYSSRYLNVNILPANASYDVSWSVDNSNLVTVYGSGKSVTVTSKGRSGTTNVYAIVRDADGKTTTCTCRVTVESSAEYNPSLTCTLGSDYYGTSVSESMARQFRLVYGTTLADNAIIRFTSTGNSRYGVMRMSNGSAIRANSDYTFREWIDMYFEPVAAGTFSLPYTLSYKGDTLSGTIDISIRGANVSATISQSSMTLATYSNQSLDVRVTPSNVYYTVSWRSSNTNIVTVSGSGDSATVKSNGNTGSTTVTATVRDRNGVEVIRSCTVTVSSKAASYNPSVSTTLGVNYVGTGTSDAMKEEFKRLYNTTLSNNATIRFSSVGNTDVAVMRLRTGSAIKANTDYTLSDYIAMYTEPVAAGTFSVPYTLTYSGKTLTGNVIVNVNTGTVNASLTLADTAPYTFNTATNNGTAGSSLLGTAITNAVGSKWSYLRFGSTSSSIGTLYMNSSRRALGSNNIEQSDLGSLYFEPTRAGEYSIPFTVFNSSGKTLATGTLYIKVGATTGSIQFADVGNSEWYSTPVYWAVGRNITNGMETNQSGKPIFSHQTTCNNAQILTFLWRAQGSPRPTISNPFNNISSSEFCYDAAIWAYEKGLISGGTFDKISLTTRGTVVEYMWKLAGRPGASQSYFSDVPANTDTSSAVSWALSRNVTGGMGNDGNGRPIFGPNETCSRGTIATFLYRAYA